jgi:hypothetical protein
MSAMPDSNCLKLAALDQEDLAVLSAHVQDAVLKVADMAYLPKEGRFVVAMNRFTWEQADGKGAYERRRAALTFDCVRAAKTNRIRRDQGDAVLELLAIEFDPSDPPAGAVTLIFAGGAAVKLDVECIEARMADLGAAWTTAAKPCHELEADEADPGR